MLKWDSSYAIGIETVDRQHEELFRRANAFFSAVDNGEEHALVKDILEYLESYIERHFQLEEAYMARHNYPEKDRHLQEHRYFTDQLTALKHDFFYDFDKSNRAIVQLYSLLGEWFKDHILFTDRKLGQFLAKWI